MAYQELIIGAPDIEIYWNMYGIPFKLNTVQNCTWTDGQTVENINSVSSIQPIGTGRSTATYTIDFTIQSGEAIALLQAINGLPANAAVPIASFLQVENSVFSVVYLQKGLINPTATSISFSNCFISNSGGSVAANDTNTPINISMQATVRNIDISPI